ncbi:hypothetical protein B0H19DRAFT_1258876 [Mycena capillaripes]|nr:hypothetical protein B0H19DRAFT_1258876 [Mycena capillaripes]
MPPHLRLKAWGGNFELASVASMFTSTLAVRLLTSISNLRCIHHPNINAKLNPPRNPNLSPSRALPSHPFSSTAFAHLASTATHAPLSGSATRDEHQWGTGGVGDQWVVS